MNGVDIFKFSHQTIDREIKEPASCKRQTLLDVELADQVPDCGA